MSCMLTHLQQCFVCVCFFLNFVYHRRTFNTVELLKTAIITEWHKTITTFRWQ